MSYLLKTGSPNTVSNGTVLGSILYQPQTRVSDVENLLKRVECDVLVHLPTASNDDVVSLLNSGAKAFVASSLHQLQSLADFGVPENRIVVDGAEISQDDLMSLISKADIGGVISGTSEQHELLDKFAVEKSETTKVLVPVFQVFEDFEDLLSTFAKSLRSDREDKLITTVVSSFPRHRTLGLCYSSVESITEAVRTRTGVYQSRKRGLWYKGASSGATQTLRKVLVDCDSDAIEFVVEQTLPGFCHFNTFSCFGNVDGIDKLEQTVTERKVNAVDGSYTQRLFSDPKLLNAKIKEEADELCEAETKDEISWEAADLLYFMSVKLAKHGLTFADVEANLDKKSLKVTRRKGDAKPQYLPASPTNSKAPITALRAPSQPAEGNIEIAVVPYSNTEAVKECLKRPAQSSNAFELTKPIVEAVRTRGDEALIEFTAKFEKAQLKSPVLTAPFSPELMKLEPALKESIDLACDNVYKFHKAQITETLTVETCKGVVCRRFSRPIAKVGLYVPGGTAILPSTAIHLGVPAKVAGCSQIVVASPPRPDGTPSPEVVYVAHKIGATQIVLAGGAQAVAAMAYGTKEVIKVDKILGPGNQFVTAAKMLCSTDVNAQVSIDMPAGPSEVLVIADKQANKRYVVSDLLSQAEHGVDSQVVLISIDWDDSDVKELQAELHKQATQLPRVQVVRKCIAHSSAINVPDIKTAFDLSNEYAPEHLILQLDNASKYVDLVNNAGSVFVGALSPESCGDYTSGTNHTLPTYGYANQYSGVNTDTYLKYITSQELSKEGLKSIGEATVILAEREGLQAHANAVKVRLADQ